MEDYESEYEELLAQHRKEKKDLQAKITKLRTSVPRTDKKKKKEIGIEIEALEEDLKVRQEQEIDDIKRRFKSNNDSGKQNGDADESGGEDVITSQEFKPSKSARRRENKERKVREQQERIAAGTIDDSENLRILELKKIEETLLQRDFYLVDVPSDGDCMYRAILEQLKLTRSRKCSVGELRRMASEYIASNKDDFWPFLTNDDGDLVSDEEFVVYCNKIANTKTWGGHLELKALSNVLQAPIEVIQYEGAPVQIGFQEFGRKNPLVICYFRYAYQLGEHYNSVQPINISKEKDEEWHS